MLPLWVLSEDIFSHTSSIATVCQLVDRDDDGCEFRREVVRAMVNDAGERQVRWLDWTRPVG